MNKNIPVGAMKIKNIKTTVKLHDLGQFRQEWKGILSPLYNEEFIQTFIHKQFLDEAENYIELYQNSAYWKGLLEVALPYLSLDEQGELNILDVGSGGGNTVFPLFELFPNANIIASDLSVPLLKNLKRYHEDNFAEKSCVTMQLNAEDLVFEPEQLDLVVGGAILHHLFDPAKAIGESFKVLKHGGSAIFFEPFEAGNQILGLIFSQLIEENKRISNKQDHIPDEVIKLFQWQLNDFSIRKSFDKSLPVFKEMDDKWLFTQQYFQEVGRGFGFREIIIYPLHRTERCYFNQIRTILRLGAGKNESVLPEWALDYVMDMDARFSNDLKKDLLLEGCIIFRK